MFDPCDTCKGIWDRLCRFCKVRALMDPSRQQTYCIVDENGEIRGCGMSLRLAEGVQDELEAEGVLVTIWKEA